MLPLFSCGQVQELHPELGWTVDKTLQGEIEQLKHEKYCEEFWKGKSGQIDREKLSKEETITLDSCGIDLPEYWSINGIGCSWYCGGGQDSLSASSVLLPNKSNTYAASNAHDLSYKTAWVEGADGYGIGEYLIYHVQPTNPRITEIIVVNGYVKSEQAWKENSRVKKLLMSVDDKAYAYINLEDSMAEQHFKIKPLGNDPKDWDEMEKLPVWTMKFEITEVYPGDKYEDTAITEIYFDGIDVH
ncbi:MAG: hypothetical protein HKO56_02600, partial [Bacteroidia bacterium]|nr:hypothetical protein [Bacteroidia bacterium]